MATVEVSVSVGASLAETWDRFFDEAGWPAWVDGFAAVIASDGYPEVGGTLAWRSIAAGRGDVVERVLEHDYRRRHRVAFTDPAMEGELETRFEIEGEGTRVTQALTYRLLGGGLTARLGGVLFVKGQVRASIDRSLLGLEREVNEAET